MKKKEEIPDKEKKIWEEYLKNPKDLFDKENFDDLDSVEAPPPEASAPTDDL